MGPDPLSLAAAGEAMAGKQAKAPMDILAHFSVPRSRLNGVLHIKTLQNRLGKGNMSGSINRYPCPLGGLNSPRLVL